MEKCAAKYPTWENMFFIWRKACENMSTRQSALDALDFQVHLEKCITYLEELEDFEHSSDNL